MFVCCVVLFCSCLNLFWFCLFCVFLLRIFCIFLLCVVVFVFWWVIKIMWKRYFFVVKFSWVYLSRLCCVVLCCFVCVVNAVLCLAFVCFFVCFVFVVVNFFYFGSFYFVCLNVFVYVGVCLNYFRLPFGLIFALLCVLIWCCALLFGYFVLCSRVLGCKYVF